MQFVQRHEVISHPEYWAEIDEYKDESGQQFLLFHIRFAEFNKQVLKRAIREWKVLRSVVQAPLFAYAEQDDEKWRAFVSLFGFKPTDTFIDCQNGEKRRVYVSIKDLPDERQQPAAAKQQPDDGVQPVGADSGRATERHSGADPGLQPVHSQ
jgi:hypothetical protein